MFEGVSQISSSEKNDKISRKTPEMMHFFALLFFLFFLFFFADYLRETACVINLKTSFYKRFWASFLVEHFLSNLKISNIRNCNIWIWQSLQLEKKTHHEEKKYKFAISAVWLSKLIMEKSFSSHISRQKDF